MFPRIFAVLLGFAVAIGLAAPSEAFVPIPRTQYNVPQYAGGTTSQQLVNINQMKQAISDTPKGATIRISIYSFYSDVLADSLIRAKARGVHIHFLTHEYAAATPQVQKVKKVLGTNTKSESWMKICAGSCARSGKGYLMHSKLLSISSYKNGSKTVRYTVFVLSGNMGEAAGAIQWNQFQTIVDRKFYLGTINYIDTLKDDRDHYDMPVYSSSNGVYQMSFFPRKKQQAEPIYEVLKDLSPRYNCRLRFAQYVWGSTNQMIADRIAVLRKGGCDIKVALTNKYANAKVVSTLVNANIPTWNTETSGSYMHAKVTMLRGRVNGKDQHYVWTGSKNYSKPGATGNAETLLRINSLDEFNSQFTWFEKVTHSRGVKQYTKQTIASKTLAGSNQK